MKQVIISLFIAGAMMAQSAAAQETTNRVAAETDWSIFVAENPKECFAVTAPKETVNTRDGRVVSVNRGDIRFFVFYRPSAQVKGQVTFTAGYPFAEGSAAVVEIDGNKYELATKGEWAWPPTAGDDQKIVAAMKLGAKAVVSAQSGRGTKTKDTFSLLGFTKALETASKNCGG